MCVCDLRFSPIKEMHPLSECNRNFDGMELGSHVGGGTRKLLCSSDMKTFGYCIGSLSSGVQMHMLMRKLRNTRDAVFEQACPKPVFSILA